MNPETVTHPESRNIADALFSATRQKVLSLLFTQPDQDFSIGELIEKANAGSGAVQREVTRLAESGLVSVELKGRQKRYHANKKAPVFRELRSLVMKTLGPPDIVKKALQSIDSQLELALIYGSVAKHTDNADSDIDLMLVSDSLTLEDVFTALGPAEEELSRPVNPTLYTRQEFDKRREQDNPFLRKVLNGPHIVLKGLINEQRTTGEPGEGSETAS